MRLIDADDFAESLISCTGLGRRSFEAVLNALKEQPTAYDVDKVMEQLEEGEEFYRKQYEKYLEDEDFGNWEAYKDAIEIVRKGGVSDD